MRSKTLTIVYLIPGVGVQILFEEVFVPAACIDVLKLLDHVVDRVVDLVHVERCTATWLRKRESLHRQEKDNFLVNLFNAMKLMPIGFRI